MTTNELEKATSRGVSLFPDHLTIIEQCARERRLRGNTFSPALQYIIEAWDEQRRLLALLPAATLDELRRQLATLSAAPSEETP